MTVDEHQDDLARWMGRHRVSRRAALKGAAGATGTLALAGLGSGLAAAAPAARGVTPGSFGIRFSGRHIAYGPDPTSEMWLAVQISGRPPAVFNAIVVEYGETAGYGSRVGAEVRNLISEVPQVDGSIYAAEQFYLHVLLTGLHPGRAYHYRWRMADGTVTADARFRTAPPAGSLRAFNFTAVADEGLNEIVPGINETTRYPVEVHAGKWAANFDGDDNYYHRNDTRRTRAPAQTIMSLIAADPPAFNLVGGDICYAESSGYATPIVNLAGGRAHNYDPYVWDTYLALIDASAASTPWMFASGEHEMEMVALRPTGANPTIEAGYDPHGYGGLLARLDLGSNGPLAGGAANTDPSRRTLAPTVYSFVHQNVAVISLDANELSYEITPNAGYTDGAQLTWLTAQLAGFRTRSDIDWIVVFFHQCAYCTGVSHGSDEGVRSVLDPLFSEYRVDLVFQGHNHQYERTDPIIDGKPTGGAPIGSTIYPDTQGTTYVVVGSGGRPRALFPVADSYAGHPGPVPAAGIRSFLVEKGGRRTDETVHWSRVRYSDYAYARVAVRPARPGQRTTMTVTGISDQQQTIDHVVLSRVAGQASTVTYGPQGHTVPVSAPESPAAIALPVAAVAVGAAAVGLKRHRSRVAAATATTDEGGSGGPRHFR